MTPDLQREHLERARRLGVRSTLVGMAINAALAVIKGIAGVLGNSYALIADAIESAADVVTSFVVLLGVRMAGKPADANHPYGHGKFEPLAAAVVSLTLLGAAVLITVESVREILTPHHAPAPFTLGVLLAVIVIKEVLARYVGGAADTIGSVAVKSDAFHHRADAITSGAAFIGISIAVFGGEGFETADDVAAVVAAVVIGINALILLRPALSELIDHEVAHNVGEAIHSALPAVAKVLVHVEPADDFGRRSRDMVI